MPRTNQIPRINARARFPNERYTCDTSSIPSRPNIVLRPPINVDYSRMHHENDVIIGDTAQISFRAKYNLINNISRLYMENFGTYRVVDNNGLNYNNARKIDICLAKYSIAVAEDMNTGNACYTGVKYALLSAGIINDYGEMPKGSAKDSISYFSKNPDKFEKVNVSPDKLKDLPAGYICVYTKDGKDGHIAITNGNGQEMSDCTDNMKWLEEHGRGSSVTVYRLTNNWSCNQQTKKLQFNPPKK